MTTPVDPDRKQALQDFRATLPPELKAVFDSMIKAKGEAHVHSILGHLKESLEEAIHL
jgi:hypothetical protein